MLKIAAWVLMLTGGANSLVGLAAYAETYRLEETALKAAVDMIDVIFSFLLFLFLLLSSPRAFIFYSPLIIPLIYLPLTFSAGSERRRNIHFLSL